MTVLARLGSGLLRALAVVVAVAVLAWLLAEAAPGTPSERAAAAAGILLPEDTSTREVRAQILDRVAREHHLRGSIAGRLGRYTGGLVRGDFGRSWRDGNPVRPRVLHSAGATLWRVFAALLLALVFGGFAALLAARRPGSVGDVTLASVAAVAVSLPPVWIAILLLRTFAAGQPWSWFPLDDGILLPVITLALVPTFVIARHLRAGLLEAAAEPWAVAAMARGVSRDRVLAVHALRNTAPVLLSIAVTLLAYLLGASLVIEEVFGVRGLGQLMVDAATRGDAPMVVGASVVAAAVLALGSAAVQTARPLLDPRLEDSDAA